MSEKSNPKSVKFWTFANDAQCRITLHDGQTLAHSSGGPTDEGYAYEWDCWTYDAAAGIVTREHSSEARDCDGRFDTYGECECPVSDLSARVVGLSDCPNPVPEWREVSRSQRDHSAEDAGY